LMTMKYRLMRMRLYRSGYGCHPTSVGRAVPTPIFLCPGKGKENQVQVVLDDDEVSSDEDAPLQKWLQLSSDVSGLSGSVPAMADVAAAVKATVDKETVDKRP
jgi:hypothetical protein